MKRTKYFTLAEMLSSVTAKVKGINNTPTFEVVNNLQRLITSVLDPVRESLGIPIHVNSGYRCTELNNAIGGVRNSQHTKGLAADLTCKDMVGLINAIKKNGNFDQLITEHCKGSTSFWVHVSVAPEFGKPRNQVILNLEKK